MMWWTLCFFFCKQKTAYEMLISDWSSDVCSSDLWSSALGDPRFPTAGSSFAILSTGLADDVDLPDDSESHSTELNGLNNSQGEDLVQLDLLLQRSEESSVGKACVSPCGSRESQYH